MHSLFRSLNRADYPAVFQDKAPQLVWRHDRSMEKRPIPMLENPSERYYNAFIQESALDEMAFTSRMDPLAMRRQLMKPYPAALTLIDHVSAMSAWTTPLPRGKARGFAFSLSFGTWVATVLQISETEEGLRVDQVFCAADPGPLAEDRAFKAQMTSAVILGLSAAMGDNLDQAENRPEIELDVLGNSSNRGADHEPAVPPIAPALANAVFALTGKRVRSMPVGDEVTFF